MNSAAIILAAGRGSRMLDLTADRPKCLVELAGRPLLHWQLAALHKAGIDKICVVRGYRAACLDDDCKNWALETRLNPHWAKTNMLASLLCAEDYGETFFGNGGDRLIISYSDIVYNADHVKKLLQNSDNIAIAYDTEWESLWKLRFANPLDDAETFIQRDGYLQEIGNRTTDIDNIQGQYMGLLAFDQTGWKNVVRLGHALGEKLKTTDMTTFLRHLLNNNIAIGAVPVRGQWCEADSGEDLEKYEAELAKGSFSHDWR